MDKSLPKTVLNLLKTQLQELYIRINKDIERMTAVRNWYITVLLATFTVVSSEQIVLSGIFKNALPFLVILFFWSTESLQRTYMNLHCDMAQELEIILLKGSTDCEDIEDCLFITGEFRKTKRYRLKLLVKALFTSIEGLAFYGLPFTALLIIQIFSLGTNFQSPSTWQIYVQL